MADFDKLSDTKGTIINFIEEQVRELFYGGGTEYDFSLWIQAKIAPNLIVGTTSNVPKPIGPNGILTSADGILGIPSGAWKDLASRWEAFMKLKQINLLYKFAKFSDWQSYWELVSYLNKDLANLGKA